MRESETPRHPDSLWAATAPPLDYCAPLEEAVESDVVIVGAGFTGLSTALHLAESGISCVVVDQAQPGWGCSGRNGGQVNPMWKVLSEDIRARYDGAEFDAMLELVSKTCDLVFELIDRHDIACDAIRPGYIHTAIGSAKMRYEEQWVKQWRFAADDVELIDRRQVEALTGTDAYDGATLVRSGGSLQPLSYTRGLARAALSGGAKIYGDSKALSVDRVDNRWRVTTGNGSAHCSNLVLATNGYTDGLWPGLKQTIVPVASLLSATRPLSEQVAASITPERHAVSESSGLPHYYRIDANRRMVFGGRGSWTGRLGKLDTRSLRHEAIALYPALAGAEWEYDWGGYVAMTTDHRPTLLQLDSGVYAGLGYNGRGVAMATMMGKQLAEVIVTGSAALKLERPRRIPLHPLYAVGVASRLIAGKVRDRLTRRV